MIADVAEHLERVPFVPFRGSHFRRHEYSVPAVDHAFVTSRGYRVIVRADDGAVAILGLLHINGVIEQPNRA